MVPYASVVPVNPFPLVPMTIHYLGLQTKQTGLDPIQAQLLQAKDPALAVYELFESSKAAEFWKEQLKQPCVTGLGRAVDALCGKAYALYQITVRSIFHKSFNLEEHSGISKRDLSSDALNCSNKNIVIADDNENEVNISFVVERKNGKCERLDPAQFAFGLWSWDGPVSQTTCKILKCVKDKMYTLQDLIPCVDAPEINRTYDSLRLGIISYIPFKYFIGNKMWTFLISYKNHTFHNSSTWQYNQVINTIANNLYLCEQEQIEPTHLPTDLPTIVKVVMLMSAVSFIPVVGFAMYKLCRKKKVNGTSHCPKCNKGESYGSLWFLCLNILLEIIISLKCCMPMNSRHFHWIIISVPTFGNIKP